MGIELPERLSWAEKAMQGLAFWIGHRHAFFADYPLPEAALVTEACNLIQANLPHGLRLQPERQYKDHVPPRRWKLKNELRARADLVVIDSKASSGSPPLAVIEVKRGSAAKGRITQDLLRLAALKRIRQDTRCFLFVVAESRRPKDFVDESGKARLGKHPILGSNAHYRVRRACKAAAAFSGKESAHYSCIVEVFH